jgi:hypothetical protein
VLNIAESLSDAADLAPFLESLDSTLIRISHGPVRNAHGVPTFVGVSRESFRPGKLLPKQLATGDLLRNRKICEEVRLTKIFKFHLQPVSA